MATVTRTYLVDDLDGTENDVSTVRFNLDRKDYEIDLSAANQARLRDKLARFLEAAAPVRGPGRAGNRSRVVKAKALPPGRDQRQAIRDWARTAGHEVSSRGRISKAIQEAFDQAH